ncbi:MAG TPA: hypothetical protein VGF35_04125, partial [Steroidobacteraceae bacterium]
MKHHRSVWLRILAAGLMAALCLQGCSRHAPDTQAQAGAGGAPGSPSAPDTALRGSFVFGADQQALRSYLENVHEVKPTKFEVEWSKEVVAVSRE